MSQVPHQLRPANNGSDAYLNGNGDGGNGNGSNVRNDGSSSNGSGYERRAGGYGGFYNGTSQNTEYQQEHPRSRTGGSELDTNGNTSPRRLDRVNGDWNTRPRSRERIQPGESSRHGGSQGGQQIEEVLQYIQQDWSFMTEDQCVPVQVALQLMDSSSLGRANQYQQFQDTHTHLQEALKVIVNEHHQGFNSSIGTFHKIQSSIQSSQTRLRTLRDSLIHAKTSLSTTKPELKGLATSSQSYDEMLQIMGRIEQLQAVPEQLEARISEKRFLTAVDVLLEGLRLVRRSDMESIGALSDLRLYLSNQEASMTDILIEELHNHLYLKSPYCQGRWKPYSQEVSNGNVTGDGLPSPMNLDGKSIHQFLDGLDTTSQMVEEISGNPEANNFYYIQLIVESLNKIGRLDMAVDRIEQRLPVELFRVVDKTNSEVDQRHSSALRNNTKNEEGGIDIGFGENDVRKTVIFDLLWTLYSKFEAIAEGHRVLHDVITGIVKREGMRNTGSLTGGFKELWKLYQSEMRSLLHDYLATDGATSQRSGQGQAGGDNVFHRNQRDKSKRMFKISDIDAKSAEMSTEQEDLDFILKSSVPGLVSESHRPADITGNENTQFHDGSATGHKLLIQPSVFNMGLLLAPSLSFLQRLKDIVPPGSDILISTLTSFLDDFLVNVFHPQLDETLAELSAQIFVELDAFQEDPRWPTRARKPIFKGTSAFFSLITAFCKMLDTIPHDQAFSQLIITQMITYYEKCSGWYKALIARGRPRADNHVSIKAGAAYAESGEVHDVVASIWQAEGDRSELITLETGIIILKTNEVLLEPADIITDRKAIASLCLLYASMKWLANKINQLRHITDRGLDSNRRESGKTPEARRWTLINPTKPRDENAPIYLPMTQESVGAFDGLVTSYNELAKTVLFTLHMEIRCHVIYHIGHSLLGKYQLEQPVNNPEPSILGLNANLVNFDEIVTKHVRQQEHEFITTGISHLLDQLLVKNASLIKAININGCGRMQLNILVLQQNLKNIERDAMLSRSARFFELFAEGPDAIVTKAKESGGKDLGFSYDELKVLVELCYSDGLNSPRRDVAMQAKRGLNDHLLQLSEHLWQT
ncbi:MAG: hypothetical protein M1827_000560 [Pycnora praestabilis]|nr:MAG: hypothetical protein M1827_000560 [Pycnora praestabilis]